MYHVGKLTETHSVTVWKGEYCEEISNVKLGRDRNECPTAFAADIPQAPTPQNSSECTIMPCADVIVYKYRFENGKYQYRRWNETRGYWVDPYWIDVPH